MAAVHTPHYGLIRTGMYYNCIDVRMHLHTVRILLESHVSGFLGLAWNPHGITSLEYCGHISPLWYLSSSIYHETKKKLFKKFHTKVETPNKLPVS